MDSVRAGDGTSGSRTTHRYAVVDVFADRPLTGNPLAVVTDADDLTDEQMAAVAVEFNLSETTFVRRPTRPGADHALRCFTAGGDEVGGAGHNALGAWWWLVTVGAARAPGAVQELGGQILPVHVDVTDEVVTIGLDQGPAELAESPVTGQVVAEALTGGDPLRLDPALPPVTGSVGSTHLLVALASRRDVDAADPYGPALARVLAAAGAEGCYVYSRADDGHDAYCRFFNPTVGIAEDPATGTAAGPLAAHLHRHGLVGDRARFLQGHAMGRPSVLTVDVTPAGTRLTGRCALAATGELHL
ncbi:PhzF family phenazine biosynthesis protein [Micromonospora sp. WMMC241]|uniref:PhzF family phenazine biosynthesis protein n=1 Tax=Micromonospora sp. WMMC241 TaxID=3015159 RepID=UPI0022B6F78D|nr:PhzF family phenazine biosynthesis protein [Micromonospora sp. WMMC241]MCZ7439815.1 PhzF family phenazine biosynthesis protein [Micromonospora sp. WMMC241]